MVRNKGYHVKVTQEEAIKIEKNAKQLGLQPATYLRVAGLSPYLFLSKNQLED